MEFASLLIGSFVYNFWKYNINKHLLTLIIIFTDSNYSSVVCMLHNFLFWYSCRTIAHRSLKVGMGDHGSIGMSKEKLGNSGFILHIFFNCWLQMVVQWNELHYFIVESKRARYPMWLWCMWLTQYVLIGYIQKDEGGPKMSIERMYKQYYPIKSYFVLVS